VTIHKIRPIPEHHRAEGAKIRAVRATGGVVGRLQPFVDTCVRMVTSPQTASTALRVRLRWQVTVDQSDEQ